MTRVQHGWLACGLAAVVAAVAGTGPAVAQTYGIDFRNTLMPASGGMAGTSVAAPQDFLSAINANPAALTHYKGTHFTLGGAFAEATVNLEQKSAVPLLGVAPFSAKSSTPGAIVPAIGVAQEVEGLPVPMTVGLAVLGAAGGGSSYVQEPASNATSSYLLLLEFAPSLAVELTERLSLGATMFIGDGYASGPFVGTSGMTNAYALRAGLGLDYQLGDATWLGAYYQSTQAFRFENEAVLFSDRRPRDVDMGLPQQVGLGIANESLMDGRLLLAADALYLDWPSAALFKSIYRGQWVMQLGTQYRATDRVKLRLGYALAQNPINEAVGTRIGPIEVPGGIPAVKYLQSQFAIINEHRLAAGIGVSDLMMRGLDFDAFAGGMFPAGESLGDATYVSVESYWIGLGFTWHFDRPPASRPRAAS
ncbi:MAG: outer membrane protein transport protein [Planctomycetia bacterium]|nr:outer membrane protein transport protein [Planctomycetia bacterium]